MECGFSCSRACWRYEHRTAGTSSVNSALFAATLRADAPMQRREKTSCLFASRRCKPLTRTRTIRCARLLWAFIIPDGRFRRSTPAQGCVVNFCFLQAGGGHKKAIWNLFAKKTPLKRALLKHSRCLDQHKRGVYTGSLMSHRAHRH